MTGGSGEIPWGGNGGGGGTWGTIWVKGGAGKGSARRPPAAVATARPKSSSRPRPPVELEKRTAFGATERSPAPRRHGGDPQSRGACPREEGFMRRIWA